MVDFSAVSRDSCCPCILPLHTQLPSAVQHSPGAPAICGLPQAVAVHKGLGFRRNLRAQFQRLNLKDSRCAALRVEDIAEGCSIVADGLRLAGLGLAAPRAAL